MPQTQEERHTLTAAERDNTLNPRQLRSNGLLPATVYGKNFPSRSIQLPKKEFTRLYNTGARFFQLDGVNLTVKVQQVQYDHLSLELLNVEFMVEAA
jgi:ribosomal protein L25 (general stress protein Ctc)